MIGGLSDDGVLSGEVRYADRAAFRRGGEAFVAAF